MSWWKSPNNRLHQANRDFAVLEEHVNGTMRHTHANAHCTIIPPYLLESAAVNCDEALARKIQGTLVTDELRRSDRARRLDSPRAPAPEPQQTDPSRPHRLVHDAQNREELPGVLVRPEGEPSRGDIAVDEAYDGLGSTWTLFHDAFGRRSLDDRGMALSATVHFGQDYDNAFWDGRQLVFGDGDGELFNRFTASLDVIGHELAHGVIEHTAGLVYRDQSGALNESLADVFGVMVQQQVAGQTAEEADWLIGAELLTSQVNGVALRSMKAPGTAYDDPRLGKDPQPGHMDDFVVTSQDNGGVHINSGIPNRAFQLAATAIGGHAWEGAGLVWYDVMVGDGIRADCDFATFAHLCEQAAQARFGADSAEAAAVAEAWQQVGVQAQASGTRRAEPAVPRQGGRREVLVRRSGGFAGVTRESRIDLDEVSSQEAAQWHSLLDSAGSVGARPGGSGAGSGGGSGLPDGFSYQVQVPGSDIDLTIPETALPGALRESVRRRLK